MPQPHEGINDKVVELLDDLGRRQRWWRSEARKTGMRPKELASSVDERSAHELRWGLKLFFPGDGIVGEELPPENESADRTWIVDPLDGSRNFAHGLALWGISVALVVDDRPVLGVYHLPDVRETFVVTRGEGAWFNGERLQARKWGALDEGDMVSVGGLDVPEPLRRGALRRLGCAGAELCYLAAGRLAAVHLGGARLWDVATAALVAQEAGCTAGFLDGGELWPWSPRAPLSNRTLVAWAPGVADPRGGARHGTPSA